jgi:glucose uptake protein GlcU
MLAPLVLAVLSGIFFGSWSVLLVKARDGKFENFFFVLVLVVMASVAISTLMLEGSEMFGQIGAADLRSIMWGLGGGACWGLATLSFGYALTLVGLALGYAIILGLAMFLGTSVSMFFMGGLPAGVDPMAIIYAMVGVVVALVGTVLSSHAGHLRSKAASGLEHRRDFGKGIPICILSGFLSSFFALGFAGAHERLSTWPSIFLLVSGFSLIQLLVLGMRIRKGTGWRAFRDLRSNIVYPVVGGLIFGAAVIFHFASADRVGVALAYPLMMGIQMLSGNLWSFLVFKEWDEAPKNARAFQIFALAMLVTASVLIGFSMAYVP